MESKCGKDIGIDGVCDGDISRMTSWRDFYHVEVN